MTERHWARALQGWAWRLRGSCKAPKRAGRKLPDAASDGCHGHRLLQRAGRWYLLARRPPKEEVRSTCPGRANGHVHPAAQVSVPDRQNYTATAHLCLSNRQSTRTPSIAPINPKL